jgi:hypothetical protein
LFVLGNGCLRLHLTRNIDTDDLNGANGAKRAESGGEDEQTSVGTSGKSRTKSKKNVFGHFDADESNKKGEQML